MTAVSGYAKAEIHNHSQKVLLPHISSTVEMAVWEAFSYQIPFFFSYL